MPEKPLILVVDDDATLLEMAEATLISDYRVRLAKSGAQAIDILLSGASPDLILLDVDMPEMDGFETLRRIRNEKTLSAIPILFLTGMDGSEFELTGLTLGAQDYIIKPFVSKNILARIRLRLEDGRHASQLREIREQLRASQITEDNFDSLTATLTVTEREVARRIARGMGNLEIAEELNYSPGYVKNLATLIYDKLQVNGRRELKNMLRV